MALCIFIIPLFLVCSLISVPHCHLYHPFFLVDQIPVDEGHVPEMAF